MQAQWTTRGCNRAAEENIKKFAEIKGFELEYAAYFMQNNGS